ncbi:aminotransferase class-III [Limosilactobacillus frumenti DSM 13145]|uniref:Aminotransferase class-III n=1 Tax=Limosilactobacillus frumenti DSM 13145 TaxID=1423746 RepID=A0A0R1PDM6_9LACO|nr:aspartate aminotransferase family protein [Limosilactobacillus frumenti]KRL28692.1 aminotransferase class-III [Limosilactobacillus frumenti DSM 13145]MBA2914726.1 aspartate aminotransferase family protein [Limosilactobacillus frumenti]QFG72040.1 aspartate aminotransferase family protein [Limosilactobacillus frumenti]
MEKFAKDRQVASAEREVLSKSSRIRFFDVVVDHGQGATITDIEGNQYIDLVASASTANVGHANPHVVDAVCKQAAKLIQYTPAYFANSQAARLAPRLAKLAPMSGPTEVVWGNSGAEANEAMLKFARGYTGRQYVVTYMGDCHGSSYGAASLSSISLNLTKKIGPMVPGIVKVPYPMPWDRLPNENDHDFVEQMFAQFELPFKTYLPADETAMVLLEPIQGDAGIVKPPVEYLKKVHHFCRQHGILFAIDEINQGLGRSGKWWSIQHFGIEPDLMAVGKSLANGLSLSAVVGRREIMESLGAPAHVFTTAGNPITTAAANATLDVIEQEHLPERSARLGQVAAKFFAEEQKKYDFIKTFRMYGLNGAVEIVDPATGKPDNERLMKILYRALQKGVILIALGANMIRFQPPLIIPEEQLQEAFAILDDVFHECAQNKLTLPANISELGW